MNFGFFFPFFAFSDCFRAKKSILLNGKSAKASARVKEGDIIEILFAGGSLKCRVLSVKETVKKDEAASLYEVIA